MSDALVVPFAVLVTPPGLWSVRDVFWDDGFSSRAKEIVSLVRSLSLFLHFDNTLADVVEEDESSLGL